MREIKFRYFVKFVNRMKSGDPISEKVVQQIFTIEEIEQGRFSDWISHVIGSGYGTVELLARQQHTGLKDKNGKEIFEGDVLADPMNEQVLVDFHNAAFCAKFRGGVYYPLTEILMYDDVRIIGNQFENPELLNPVLGVEND